MSLSPYKITAIKSFDATGQNVLGGASVSILNRSGGYASIYTDSTGATPVGNPFTVDTNGEKEVWINGGEYQAIVAGGQAWDFDIISSGDVRTIATVADISTTPMQAGQIFDLVEYYSGTGKGGGQLKCFAGSITPDNGITFSGPTGFYLQRINTVLTVEHYGAKGDGATNDSAAFLAMAAGNGGDVVVSDSEYLVNNLVFPSYNQVRLIGQAMPGKNTAITKLTNGSILLGSVSIRANNVLVHNLGIDDGSARGLVGITDGLVINAKTGENGGMCVVNGVASMGPDYTGTTHGVLIQGFEGVIADKIYCAEREFGLVVKCRNSVISNISGDNIRTALCYPKSDLSASAGGVADGSGKNFEISNVQLENESGLTTGSAVYIHGSTVSISSASVTNVSQIYGHSALRIQGGGLISDPNVSNISASNIRGERSQYAVYLGGYNYYTSIVGIKAINTSTGSVAYIDANSTNWHMSAINHVITDAGIAGTVVFACAGTGTWDDVIVNTINAMTINCSAANLKFIKTGKYYGNVKIQNEGALTGINGAVAAAETPMAIINPNSVVQLAGRFNLAASTNKFFCNLPFNTGKQKVFSCGGIDSGGNYVTTAVRLNDFQLSIEPTLPANYTVDLSNISVVID